MVTDDPRILEHIMSCDVCMAIIVDLSVASSDCMDQCVTLQAILAEVLADPAQAANDRDAGRSSPRNKAFREPVAR